MAMSPDSNEISTLLQTKEPATSLMHAYKRMLKDCLKYIG